jgi:histidine triad (HIT) family protein
MSGCLFCAIVEGTVPARIVRQDGSTVAFEDIAPQAPLHVLVVPRRHVASVSDLEAADGNIVAALFLAAREVARDRGVADYRLVVNNGAAAGQSVFHLHLHVLGGRPMGWPPG